MPDETPNAPKRRVLLQAAIGIVLLVIFVAAAWYLTSPQFRNYVRGRIVDQLERATGGRVEMARLRWNLSRLTVEVEDLTIHGLEGSNEVPYVHVDRLAARAKIISLWQRDIGLHYLEVQRPVIHLITYPDGTTNQPTPKVKEQQGNRTAVEYLFDLAIERAEVRDGTLLLNDRAMPFDFSGNDLQAGMTFAQADQRYDGTVHAGKLDAKFKDMRPLAANMDLAFSLFPKKAQLRSLRLSTGRSQVEASGTLDDFTKATMRVSYRAQVDLAELGGVARLTELRSGTLDLNGQGKIEGGKYASTGTVAVRNFSHATSSVRIANAAGSANFEVDQDVVVLKDIVTRVFGGIVSGDITVRNWNATTNNTGTGAQRGIANFTLRDVSVSQVADAVSSKSMPLGKLNLAGTGGGTVRTTWTGAPSNAIAEVALEVVPPPQPAPEQLPLNARARGTYRNAGGRLELAELAAATRATRLNASGTLGSTAANLKVALTSTDLGEFKPALAVLQQSTQLPVELHGQASFNGVASGTTRAPSVAGHLEVRDFDSLIVASARGSTGTQGTAVPAAAAPQKITRMHWDLLAADVLYSPTQAAAHNGVLRHGSAQVAFDASTALRKGKFLETSPFSARVNIRNANLADIQTLAGLNYPVSGTLNLNANVSGTQRDPRGEGRVVITNAVAYGEPVRQVSSDIRFVNQQAQFSNIDLVHNGSHVTGAAAYNLTAKSFRFDFRGNDIDLTTIRQLRARTPVSGLLTFVASGSGTPEAPVLNANVRVRNVVAAGEELGDIVAEATTSGETLKLTGRANYQNSDFRLDGSVRLREDFPATISVRMRQVDIDPLLRTYLKGRLTGHSVVAGDIDARGPLKKPALLTVNGTLTQLSLDVANVKLQNDGPVEFAMANEVARVRRLRVVGEDTQLNVTGELQLSETKPLNLSADGKVNLKLLQTVNPDVMSYGSMTLHAKVGGTLAQPAMQGTMQIANAGLSYIDLPNGLADINGTLVFNQDRVQIQQLTGKTGGGTLNLGGFVTYGRTVGFNVTARAKDIRLRYPPGISAMADADLHLTGNLKNSLLSGDVTVTKFGVNPRFDFALYLARSKQPPTVPDPNSPLNNLRLDIHITSTPELQVETSLAKISGNADLRVRGSGTRPAVLGRVSIIEGDVFFNATKYHLERGDVTFTNPVRIEPVVDVEATTTVRNYEISLGFHGPLDKLSTTYRSDPPLATGDIIQLLAFGRTREEMAQQSTQQTNFTESASNAILSQALNSAVSSRVQKLFGVTRVKVDPRIGGAENNPSGARVTIEQQVANNLTVTYITDLTRSSQQVIQVEYNLNRNVSLVAVRNEYGVVGFDVRIRQRKR